jgi:hypothetical protein
MRTVRRSFISTVLAAAVLFMAGAWSLVAQQEMLVSANVAEVGKGYRTSDVRGRAVWNDRNERIGIIPEVVIGRDDVPFAILEVGGFLDLGAHMVAVPFKALKSTTPAARSFCRGRHGGLCGIFRNSGFQAERKPTCKPMSCIGRTIQKFPEKLTGVRAVRAPRRDPPSKPQPQSQAPTTVRRPS